MNRLGIRFGLETVNKSAMQDQNQKKLFGVGETLAGNKNFDN
jgi:hypothetical protein